MAHSDLNLRLEALEEVVELAWNFDLPGLFGAKFSEDINSWLLFKEFFLDPTIYF